jgi:hypothetical protein
MQDIEKVYNSYMKLVGLLDDRSQSVKNLVETLGERFVTCPAFDRNERSTAAPGGLMLHSINVVKAMKTTAEASRLDIPLSSIVICGLVHEFGRLGDLENSYYIEQSSDWHRDRGNLYTYNPQCTKMTHTHRAMWLLQSFGVNQTPQEWIAIASLGFFSDEQKFYAGYEGDLSSLLSYSDRIVTAQERT